MADTSLTLKTFKGAMWSFLQRASMQLAGFIITIIMARMLTPADYGLVAILLIFVEVGVAISEGGLSQALIRTVDVSDSDATSVLIYNVIVSLTLYALIWILSPFIALFFDSEILTPLCRVMALNIPIKALTSVKLARLTSELKFKPQAFLGLTSNVLAGVAGIVCAAKGKGVWSIAVYQVGEPALQVLLLWMVTRRQRWAKPEFESFLKLFRFGSPLLAAGLIDVVYRNMYLPLIGKIYHASDLGFFTRARQFASLPSVSIGEIVRVVGYPALCRVGGKAEYADEARAEKCNEGDKDGADKLRKSNPRNEAFLKMLGLTCYAALPVMLFVALFAEPVIVTLIGEKWREAAVLLPYMSVGMMFYPVSVLNLQLIQAEGRSDYFLKAEIIKKLIGVALMMIALPFGIFALALAWAATSLIGTYVNVIYCKKCTGMREKEQFSSISGIFLLSLGCCIASRLISLLIVSWGGSLTAQLVVGLACCGILYAALSKALRIKEYALMLNLLRGIRQ